MSDIDGGIKQPLRFWDSVDKQNWRKSWIKNGLMPEAVLICPENAIVPFQIRRRRSPLPITTFDLYTYDEASNAFVYDMDLFTVIPAPLTNHLRVIQLETADNIIWYPQADFTTALLCGLHYVHISDGTNNWYSEVFSVIGGFSDNTTGYISIFSDPHAVGDHTLSKDGTVASAIITSHKPF